MLFPHGLQACPVSKRQQKYEFVNSSPSLSWFHKHIFLNYFLLMQMTSKSWRQELSMSKNEARGADAIKPCLRTEEVAGNPPSRFEPRPTVPQAGWTEEGTSTGSGHASVGRPVDIEPETDPASKPNQVADHCLQPTEPLADRPKTTGPLTAVTRNPTPASGEDRMPAVINLRPPKRIRRPARFQ